MSVLLLSVAVLQYIQLKFLHFTQLTHFTLEESTVRHIEELGKLT